MAHATPSPDPQLLRHPEPARRVAWEPQPNIHPHDSLKSSLPRGPAPWQLPTTNPMLSSSSPTVSTHAAFPILLNFMAPQCSDTEPARRVARGNHNPTPIHVTLGVSHSRARALSLGSLRRRVFVVSQAELIISDSEHQYITIKSSIIKLHLHGILPQESLADPEPACHVERTTHLSTYVISLRAITPRQLPTTRLCRLTREHGTFPL